VQWECVEYSTDRWHDWFHSEEREQYYEEAFNYGALPGLTNLAWPAIWELVRSGRVPDDAVFAPGHTAVSPSEHLPDNILEDDRIGQAAVVKYLKNANYKLWGWDDEALDMVLNDRIRRDIETESFADPDDAARGTAEWYWQERQAKFINGDMQVYEFWNHDWWMPLWDHEFTEFWQSIPLEYREDKAIYRRYVDDLYTEHTGVETEEAQETEMSSPIRRAHQWLYHSPVFDVIRPLYALARYDGDPRGWPGVMSRKQFASLFTGRQRAYSFFALEILDKMSFEPAENIDTPSNGKLSVDVSELEARQQARGQDIPGDVLRELPS
jgi:asparagine synthase (glutamine-hydrolysing)